MRSILRKLRTEKTNFMFWVGRDDEGPNFGDLIGPYLYEKITGSSPDFQQASNRSIHSVYLTVGSILFWCKDNSIIWGSGIVREDERFSQPHRVYSVRGPLTRKRFLELGYNCPEVYGDPGLLMSKYYQPKKEVPEKYQLGIIPHYVDQETCNKLFIGNDEVKIINVYDPIESIIDQIHSCKAIASSSLHGIIVSHSYNIPVSWIRFGDKLWGDDVKFSDHYKSLSSNANVNFLAITEKSTIQDLIENVKSSYQPTSMTINKVQKNILNACPFKAH